MAETQVDIPEEESRYICRQKGAGGIISNFLLEKIYEGREEIRDVSLGELP